MSATCASIAVRASTCARVRWRRSLRNGCRSTLIAAACAVAFGCGAEKNEPPSAAAGPTGAAVAVPAASVAQRNTVAIDNAMAGWVPTGVHVAKGDEVALLGRGTVEAAGVGFEPRHLMWYRVGENGDAERFSTNAVVFTAAADGEIFVTMRPTGILWSDRRGTYPPGFSDAPRVPIDLGVDVLRFNGPSRAALATLAAGGDAGAAAALASLAALRKLPGGFEPLWFMGGSNVWTEGTVDGRAGIMADTHDNFEIVKKPLDIPLTPTTEVAFDWRYDAVPARGPETSAEFHDYLSVALEFDNGQDLTWLWSTSLPEGTHFACPLPGWEHRETHFVLQSGPVGLGNWFSHKRNVLADYQASITGAPPSRIVGVWFIANSAFGRQRGAASFADVKITGQQGPVEVFAKP